MKTITIAAYNRPANTRILVESLLGQIGSGDWRIFARVDRGGDQFYDVIDELGRLGDCYDYEVAWPKENEGINRNTYAVMTWAFDRAGSDWNLYLEDDLELSPDALAMCDWFIERYDAIKRGYQDVAAMCLFNQGGTKRADTLHYTRRFTGWGFLMPRSSWVQYAKTAWFACAPGMWDNCLANYIRAQGPKIVNVMPDLDRVNNTGEVGSHFSAERFRQRMEGHTWQQNAVEFEYRMKK